MSSRLFQEVREKRGLAYSIYSFLSAYRDTGMWGIYTAVAKETLTQTLEVIGQELTKIETRRTSRPPNWRPPRNLSREGSSWGRKAAITA